MGNLNEQWVKCLCRQGSTREYLLFRGKSLSGDLDAIMEYRKVLRARRNPNLLFIKLEHEYLRGDIKASLDLVESIFLEPITTSHMQFLIDKVEQGRSIADLHKRYNQNPDFRFLTAVRSM